VRLYGRLTATGTAARTSLYYGDTDGATDPLAWSHTVDFGWTTDGVAQVSHLICGLSSNSTLYYTFRATNCVGEVWTASTNLVTPTYSDRLEISFCGYSGTETLTNFPVLVQLGTNIPGFDYASFGSSAGGDLRFLNAEETDLLDHEIELWDTNGVSHVWVEVPALADPFSSIVARWGSSATNFISSGTNGGPWSAEYRGVWHLGETVTDNTTSNAAHLDSSTNAFHADQVRNGPVAGVVGNGQAFDGNNDWIHYDYTSGLNPSEYTISTWVWVNASDLQAVIASIDDSSGYAIGYTSSSQWLAELGKPGANNNPQLQSSEAATPRQQWVHIAMSYDPSDSRARLWVNGQVVRERTDGSIRVASAGLPFQIGTVRSGDLELNGYVDEVR
ncbi:MAG: LamG domain-containing protein, partial [Verrucomicrobiota bacterium]